MYRVTIGLSKHLTNCFSNALTNTAMQLQHHKEILQWNRYLLSQEWHWRFRWIMPLCWIVSVNIILEDRKADGTAVVRGRSNKESSRKANNVQSLYEEYKTWLTNILTMGSVFLINVFLQGRQLRRPTTIMCPISSCLVRESDANSSFAIENTSLSRTSHEQTRKSTAPSLNLLINFLLQVE